MRNSRGRRRSGLWAFLATASMMVAALVLGAPGATAAPQLPAGAVVVTADDAPTSDVGANSFKKTCFGHSGTFADGSHVLSIDWSHDVAECYGVAPSGTIWHIWKGASKWYEMPGNGLATDMDALIDYGNGNRTVVVYVGWGSWKYYCQDYIYGSGWARSWYRC